VSHAWVASHFFICRAWAALYHQTPSLERESN